MNLFKTCKKLHKYNINLKICLTCKNEANKRYYQKNKEKINTERRSKYRNNPDSILRLNKEWKKRNPDTVRKSMRKWEANNPDQVRKNRLKHYKKHVNKYIAKEAKRRARKIQAVPSWANHEKIKTIYAECAKLTKETKIKHHVDHIYPLQSDYMCGLHVENNLQILTAEENFKKSNKVWPGQLECQTIPLNCGEMGRL